MSRARDFQDWDAGLHRSDPNSLKHYGVLGMKWGQRRYQKSDGSLTAAGKKHYENTGEYGYTYKSHATKKYTDVQFQDNDGLLFGSEGGGCPDYLHESLKDYRLTIPMVHPQVRSLNLATSVGIVRYEVFRQCNC